MQGRVQATWSRVIAAANRMPLRVKFLLCLLAPGVGGVVIFGAGVLYIQDKIGLAPDRILLTQSVNFFAVLLVVVLALSAGLAWGLARLLEAHLAAPLADLARAAEAVAAGNHAERARSGRGDEIGATIAAVNRMADELARGMDERVQSLRGAVRQSEHLARELQTAAMLILDITGELTGGSTRQREAITAATNQAGSLGSAGASIAKNARQIGALSTESLEACEQGSLVLQDMLARMEKVKNQTYGSAEQMKELLAQARRVRSVVELIDEISDQINLIALNAELEAAGAGDAGRRFMVVAEEITRLADRTLTSTEVISEAIDAIIRASEEVAGISEAGKGEVDVTLASTEEVGLFLVRLFERVEKVNKQVGDITVSTEDQLKNVNDLSEHLTGIEDLARKMEEGVMEVQNSLGLLEKISEDLTKEVSLK